MSNDQFNAFMDKASADEGLRSRLKAVTSPQAVAEIAKELGYTVLVDDLYADNSLESENFSGINGGW